MTVGTLTAVLTITVVVTAGCGGGDDGARTLASAVHGSDLVTTTVAACRFDGERQITARGTVHNRDADDHNVNLTVRFVDGDGVRVDLASDSVSSLQADETARWEASIYTDDGDSVERCEVTADAT